MMTFKQVSVYSIYSVDVMSGPREHMHIQGMLVGVHLYVGIASTQIYLQFSHHG